MYLPIFLSAYLSIFHFAISQNNTGFQFLISLNRKKKKMSKNRNQHIETISPCFPLVYFMFILRKLYKYGDHYWFSTFLPKTDKKEETLAIPTKSFERKGKKDHGTTKLVLSFSNNLYSFGSFNFSKYFSFLFFLCLNTTEIMKRTASIMVIYVQSHTA